MEPIPSLEKFKSRKEWEKYVWNKLIGELAKAVSVDEVGRSLDKLLTAHEKKQMIKRAAAASFLEEGKSYRDIGKLLWLSSSTISAIKKSLKTQKEYISRYMRNKKHKKQ